MLLKTPLAANDIVSLKLTSGEELVAKFVSEDATSYTVAKPLVLVQTQTGMAMVALVASAEDVDSITIQKSATITSPLKTHINAKRGYIKITTGIDLEAPASIQIKP